MLAQSIHVYPSGGTWTIKKEGKPAKTFPSQREAVDAAKESVRKQKAGKLVVYGKNGQIQKYEAFGMPRIQDSPKKSRIAGRIGRAVGKMALERVIGSTPSR